MIFEGAKRAEDYVEQDVAAGSWVDAGDSAQRLLASRSDRRAADAQSGQLPAGASVEPRSVLNLDAMSRDLSGSWMRDGTQAPANEARAREGVRGVLSRMGMKVAPGAKEQARIDSARALAAAETIVRQATFLRCMTVLVAQRKGGAGKTPVSILLGGMLAYIRGGSVAIPEVSDDPGMLALRSEGSAARGLGELVRDVENVRSSGQLAGYTAPQTSHAAVIGSPNPRPNLSGENVRAVHALLANYYALQVLDSGNVYSSGAFQEALGAADALVIPVTDAADSMQDALALLHHLNESKHGRDLISTATVLRLRYVDAPPQTVERVDAVLAGLGIARILDIPADAHIAEHGELSLASLHPGTRDAFLHAAAAVITALQEAQNKEKNA